MKTVSIAFRNIFRNKRRSAMTILAVGVGAISVLLMGGFNSALIYGMQTIIVQGIGHLIVYPKGFSDFGAGNPSAYTISRYEELQRWITEDPQLMPLIEVATPGLEIRGIAGNFVEDSSITFFGVGLIPSDRQKMREWNDYNLKYRLGGARDQAFGITDEDTEGGVIGIGMARMLRLCDRLHLTECSEKACEATMAGTAGGTVAAGPLPVAEDFTALAEPEAMVRPADAADKRPKLDLLAATVSGAPNVVTLYVNKAENRGDKAMDDSFISMHLSLAQRLLFGKGEKKATGIVIQLKHTKDIPLARAGLLELFKAKGLNLEVLDFGEKFPAYGRSLSFLASIFTFLSLNMGVIVLFTIVNTMAMSVMERVNEIGTIRALGVRRRGVLRQFVVEGCLLGAVGSTVGSIAAVLLAMAVNAGGFTWLPAYGSEAVPLTVEIFENPLLLPFTWLGLILLAAASSYVPARKAGRMVIVDALRHI